MYLQPTRVPEALLPAPLDLTLKPNVIPRQPRPLKFVERAVTMMAITQCVAPEVLTGSLALIPSRTSTE